MLTMSYAAKSGKHFIGSHLQWVNFKITTNVWGVVVGKGQNNKNICLYYLVVVVVVIVVAVVTAVTRVQVVSN